MTQSTLGSINETMIFFREEGFYPVQGVVEIPLSSQAAQHAELNPGTLQVEDLNGYVLWRMQ